MKQITIIATEPQCPSGGARSAGPGSGGGGAA